MSTRLFSSLSALILTLSLTACMSSSVPDSSTNSKTSDDTVISGKANPTATIETTMGNIEIELFANEVPEMAKNFIELAKEGKYDDVPFHRIINEPQPFVIQGGDFTQKNGMGGHSYKGPGTYVEGEYNPAVSSNVKGTLSWANAGPNTNGSQFFINLADNTFLDHDKAPLSSQHPVFGKVIGGMDVVDKIAGVEVDRNAMPTTPVLMTKVTIEE